MRKTVKERIESKITISDDGCWNWNSCRNAKGYGTIQIAGSNKLAHRVSYEEYVEPIKNGNYVLHHCDNPSCVNPGHLFQGTQTDNMKDMWGKGRGVKPKGEDHTAAKLSSFQVMEILADAGNQRELAKKFGISKGLVWAIKKGKAWGHLTGIRFAKEALANKAV